MTDLRLELKRASGDTRLLGIIFAAMGLIPMIVIALSGTALTWSGRVVAVVNAAVLLGPGVWYIVAGTLMRRLNRTVARTSILIALTQIAIVAVCLFIALLENSPRGPGMFAIPACMALFQVPALIALIFVLRRAQRVVELLQPDGFAFEALAVDPTDHSIDNRREK